MANIVEIRGGAVVSAKPGTVIVDWDTINESSVEARRVLIELVPLLNKTSLLDAVEYTVRLLTGQGEESEG